MANCSNVAGGRDHADAARLQHGCDTFDPARLIGETGMFVDPDRQVAVIRCRFLHQIAMIPLDDADPIGQPSLLQARLHDAVLLRHQAVIDHVRAICLGGEHRHAAPA